MNKSAAPIPAAVFPETAVPKVFLPAAVLIAAVLFLAASCTAVEIPDPGDIVCSPGEKDTVLEPGDPVRVSFGFPVDRLSAEELLEVRDYRGTVPGRLRWEGRSLFFIPEPDFIPGRRYIFSYSGSLRAENGAVREHRHRAAFHYVRKQDDAAGLLSVSPPPGSVVSGDAEITLEFSRPLDPASFGAGFAVEPESGFVLLWENDGTALRISPGEEWRNLSTLTLTFADGIADAGGFPAALPDEIRFIVQADTEPPRILSVEAAVNDPGALFPPVGTDLSACLAFRDAIRITFSETMRREETRDAVGLSPRPPGVWHWLDGSTLLFLPETGYRAGQTYTLTAGPEAEDEAGNRLLPYPPLSFVPRIEPLLPEAELPGDGIVLRAEDFSAAVPLPVTLAPPGWTDCTFAVVFRGGSFDTREERLTVQQGVSVTCLFPPSAPDPHPVGWTWTAPDRVSFTFSGFLPSTDSRRYLYLLSLRGGPDGIVTDEGNILLRSLEQILETEAAW